MDRAISLNGAAAPVRGVTPGVPLSTRVIPTRLVLLEDEALARLVARGSSRAFGVLYERYQQPLYTYCYLFLHDADDAYDALQSALTHALAALRRGERDEAFRPWLFRLASREAHALARARAASEKIAERVDASQLPWVQEPAEERARLAQLVEDLRELPELQRSALLMRELTGLSHDEIATSLGTTRLGARQAIFHARRSLEDFREGRGLVCEEVRRMLSHEDGRLMRRHVVRSHLRDCTPCTSFAESISARRADLHAVAPVLPAALAAGLLAQLAHTSGLGVAGVTAGAAGKGIGASLAANAAKVGAVGAIALTAGAGVGAVKLIDQIKPAHGAAVWHVATAGAPRGSAAGRHPAAGARHDAKGPSRVSHAPSEVSAQDRLGVPAPGAAVLSAPSPAGVTRDIAPAADTGRAAVPAQELQSGEGTTQPEVVTGGGLRLVGGSHPAEEIPPATPHEGPGKGGGPAPEGVEHGHEGIGPVPGEGHEGVHREGHTEGPAAGEGGEPHGRGESNSSGRGANHGLGEREAAGTGSGHGEGQAAGTGSGA